MESHVLVPLLGGVVLGAVGVAFGFWLRLKAGALHDPARMTFHKPAPDVMVVEFRGHATADQAQALRERLQSTVPEGTDVLVVVIDSKERML